MKFTKYFTKIALNNDNNESLLVHTLYGYIDVLYEFESNVVDKWQNCDNIEPYGTRESDLYKSLIDKKYLIENENEETKYRNNLLSDLRKEHDDRLKNVKNAYFVITYNCNFACPYCFEKDKEDSKKVMTEEMVDRIFEKYDNHLDNICFFGGEPLLLGNKKIIEYIISKAPNAVYSAITNGFFLSEYLDIFSKVKVSYIQVTLDGSKDIHNKTRVLKNGQPTYDRIISGIKLYLENNIPIRIRMNISKDNIDDCLKVRDEITASFNEYKDILYFEMQPIFQTDKRTKSELYEKLLSKDYKKFDTEEGRHANYILSTNIPLYNFLLSHEPIVPLYCFCDFDYKGIFYDAEGLMYGCILSVGERRKSIGTFYPEYKIKENSMYYRNIETVDKCSKCKYSLLCGGGCANAVIDENGNALISNCSSFLNTLDSIPTLFKYKEV